ncbi:MAG: tubulin-like doman-containing protein [Planctomycetota bacterium]
MSQVQSQRICIGYEPIPGYVLEERIGQGGYGEVWRASAPGGLKKAVKFVFGSHEESRALRELKSLERIRGVQHPFLLTLERFESIEDQLVIVTELADCSLEDVYRRNRDLGSCGIARDVLTSHLRDAADALDYLHEKYQLQHLDIKPGNLLLFGGHVKVADFGLLKDLGDVDCSVVGGLTPTYAPPELFDGRPGMHSDQYSLAVMYQELLTGTRPFNGRTIAQLATQHVHAAPQLDSLPAADRPVVARALEKNPDRRFPNCTAFVEALAQAANRKLHLRTEDEKNDQQTPAADVADLPQLNPRLSELTGKRPVAFVAIGGLGAETLRLVRERIFEAGTDSPIALQGILIDTDAESIHHLKVMDSSNPLCQIDFLHTPLRSPQDYRDTGTNRLTSISRRWIYNVPRNGVTEGMRPLGRLALVDHGAQVKRALEQCVASISEASGDVPPAVYVVGSLCGGTASGMYLDVVHLLRHLLDESGNVETSILSLLVTPPMQGDPTRPLAPHSALAAMKEMGHFLNAGNGYPGDEGAGWPSLPAARTPLRDVYFVSQPQRGSLTRPAEESIAQYLWTDSGNGHALLASARRHQPVEGQTIVPLSIRTFGSAPLADPRQSKREMLAPSLVRKLLIQWLGLPSQARIDSIELSQRVLRRSGLLSDEPIEDADRLARKANSLCRELAVCLSDQRADITTVIECFKRILEWCDEQEDVDTTAFREAIEHTVAKMERYATTLAMAIVETSKIQPAEQDPWKRLPEELQNQFDSTLSGMHSLVQNEWLVRPLMQAKFEIESISMVKALCEAADPLLARMLQQSDTSPQLMEQDASTSQSLSMNESQSHTEVTQTIATMTLDGADQKSLTVQEAVLAANPQLLSLGGLHRLILIVGSTYEKQQLEPQVRAAYDGPLSVAVVQGSTPHLIHEAQQIDLSRILTHLSTLHGGNKQVTSRLSSRSDVQWEE